jgi:DHA1 family tetracycline resistance protein-like MFS transporter
MTRGLRAFVFFTIFLEAMGGGLVGPVFPNLMQKFSSGGLSSISTIIGWCAVISSVALFVAAPFMGKLADRFGRRPVTLLTLVVAVADYVISATTTSLWVFLLTRAVVGFCAAGAVALQTVIADVTPPEQRARNFSIFGAGYGIGMVLGPPIGGFLGRAGPEGPFWVAAALFAIDLLLGLFVLKETLPKSARSTVAFKNIDPVRALLRMGRFRLGAILTVFILVQFADTVENSVMVLFQQAKFGWNTSQVGFFYSMVGVCLFISKLAVTPFILKRLGERWTILLGVLLHAVCSLVYGFIAQGWQMYIGLSIWLVAGMAAPTLMGVMSGRVADKEQGEYLGSLMSLQVVIGGAAALTGTAIFSYFTGPSTPIVWPGATFLISSVIFTAALVVGLLSGSGAVVRSSVAPSHASTQQQTASLGAASERGG